jgi:hypothetical protein
LIDLHGTLRSNSKNMDGIKHGYDYSSEKSVKRITFLGVFHEHVVASMI